MVEKINIMNFYMVRQFTVQAIQDTTMLTLSLSNIQRMQKQFNAQFNKLFKGSFSCLITALKLKAKAIKNASKSSRNWSEVHYRRN